jgi:hypothetical protein
MKVNEDVNIFNLLTGAKGKTSSKTAPKTTAPTEVNVKAFVLTHRVNLCNLKFLW